MDHCQPATRSREAETDLDKLRDTKKRVEKRDAQERKKSKKKPQHTTAEGEIDVNET